MRILVTGGAGFIGSAVVDSYVDAGHRVWAIDNESTGNRKNVNKKATYKKLDVNNRTGLKRLFKRVRFDTVNHHAAQIDVRHSVEDPVHDAKVNILGLLNILNLSIQNKVKKVIFSSSGGTVYGECSKHAKENFPENPLSPYGVAKLSAEKYIKVFRELHGLNYTIFRYANVYGPRQDPYGEAGVVAIFCGRLLLRKPVFIFGDGRQTRDFVYVKDVARANLLSIGRGNDEIMNIGSGVETSINVLSREMASLAHCRNSAVYKTARRGEVRRNILDSTKARRVIGWEASTSLEKGLSETLRYFSDKRNRP
jgi:UDP-glucose 4-epimerase